MNTNETAAALGAKRTKFGTFSKTCPICEQPRAITLSKHSSGKTVFETNCRCTADGVREALATEAGIDRIELLTPAEAREVDNGGGPKPQPGGAKPFPTLSLADIIKAPPKDPLRRVAGLIGEGDYLTLIFGPSTAGKTFLAINLFFALLLGLTWFGRATLKCGVLYIAREGEAGFYNRVKAYVQAAVAALGEFDATDLPFRVITVPVNLGPSDDGQQVEKIIATIQEMNAQYEVRVGAVFFDNMRAVAPGMHENDSHEIEAFFTKTRTIARSTGASPIILDNTGKDAERGARGTQAKYDLSDTVIEVVNNGSRAWGALKVRDGVEDKIRHGFRLEDVPIGTVKDIDGDDKEIASAIVVDDGTSAQDRKKLSRNVRSGLRILSNLIAKHGVENQPLGPNSPTVFTIEKDAHLRPAFHEQLGDIETRKLRDQALRRFLTNGKAAGVLNHKVLPDDRVLIWRTT